MSRSDRVRCSRTEGRSYPLGCCILMGVASLRTQKRVRARERWSWTPRARTLEDAHVDVDRCQGIPKSGDFAAALTLAFGTFRFRDPAPY